MSHQVAVGVSVGIALAPDDGLDPHALLRSADMALYRAKADGRNVYRFFEAEMDARMQARRSLEIDLRKAIAAGEFELLYQPIVDLQTHRISGFEALLRWQSPTRGLLVPADFIPLAEETGLIVPLGNWVLRQACMDAVEWPRDVTVAVNLSPAQFRNKQLILTVMSALAASGLSAGRLELEITETVLLQDAETTLSVLQKLREIGVRIAMDDFGTGYSSLSYLRKFPFDKIKIDQSFIRDMSDHDDSLAIVRAVVAMSSSLCIGTTAEGVETYQQLERLKSEGCTEAQGYLFSPPRSAADVKTWLAALAPEAGDGNAARAVRRQVGRIDARRSSLASGRRRMPSSRSAEATARSSGVKGISPITAARRVPSIACGVDHRYATSESSRKTGTTVPRRRSIVHGMLLTLKPRPQAREIAPTISRPVTAWPGNPNCANGGSAARASTRRRSASARSGR